MYQYDIVLFVVFQLTRIILQTTFLFNVLTFLKIVTEKRV